MSKSNSWENALLLLLFNNDNSACANIGDATGLRGSSTAGSLYLSLHTADPGEAGAQNTSEISYTGYARKAIARSSSGFTISGNTLTLVADQTFTVSSGGTGGTVMYFGIGTASSGAGVLLYSGTVTPNIVVSSGVTPTITTSGSSITED